jgi:hypothetical protein
MVTENGLVEVPLWNVNGLASASLESVLNLGQLKAIANTSVDVGTTPLSDKGAGGGGAIAQAQMSLGWGDTITVTSSNHALGEYVPFEVRLFLDRFVTASGRFGGNSQAFVSGELFGSYIPNLAISDSNFYPSSVTELTTIAYLPVGELSTIEGRLQVFASAMAVAAWPDKPLDLDYSIANASHTANYYLTPLVEGISYTSASGRTYFYPGDATPVPTPALLPGLIGLGLNLWRKRRNEAQVKQP